MFSLLGIGAKLLSGGLIFAVISGSLIYITHTIREAGAMSVERDILEQAQKQSQLRLEQSQELSSLSQEARKKQDKILKDLEEKHRKRLEELTALHDEDGEGNCKMGCIIPSYGEK